MKHITEKPLMTDAVVHEAQVPFTHGIAFASLASTYFDWLSHVAASPDKQREIAENGAKIWGDWSKYVWLSALGQCAPCALPQPQDKRFGDPAWDKVPFNWSSQAFLALERWWTETVANVPGVSSHHEELAQFVVRQLLDMLSPSNFPLSNPQVLRKTLASGGTNLVNGARNWQRDAMDLAAKRKPRGTELFLPGKNVALTPGKVVFRNRLIELIQYTPTTQTTFAEPLLIIPAWIMKYYILDLSPHNSLVNYLVGQGHTVFMVSWRNPMREDASLTLGDYLNLGVRASLDTIKKVVPGKQVHAVGYCLGGTLLAIAAAALVREKDTVLASVTLLASQLDFQEPGQLGLFIDESQIDYLESLMSKQGYLDGPQMAGAFALINSKDLVWSKLVHEYLMGAQTPMTDLRAWNADATRLPYQMHSEYLRKLYLNNDLAEGRFQVDGKSIALSDIRVPLFVVSTQTDHVSPWKSVYKVTRLIPDSELTYVLTTGGHNVGIVNPPQKAADQKHAYSYQIEMRTTEAPYVDAESWAATAKHEAGSWWLAWASWLDAHSSGKVPAVLISGALSLDPDKLEDAPGRYVGVA